MKKIKILAHLDGPLPLVFTGFAKVAKYILRALYDTGQYDINVLSINYFGNFYDKEEVPYNIVPAKLQNPGDPFGYQMLINELIRNEYDILFVINDIYVTQKVATKIAEIKAQRPNLKVVYYYPVDCCVQADAADFIKVADVPVTYNQWSKAETIKAMPYMENKIRVITHGVDNSLFHKIHAEERRSIRKQVFGIDDDTFMFINVGRNSPRKDLPRCIYAFKEFKDKNPSLKTMLYLHTSSKDNGTDLTVAIKNLGLSMKKDVVLPVKYNLTDNAVSEEMLNQIYNAADCGITTNVGEGWGFFESSEGPAAELLMIVPDNTCHPEVTNNGEWAVMYPCNDITYTDNSGYRKQAHMKDIVDAMQYAYKLSFPEKKIMINQGKKWAESIDWKIIGSQWVSLFDNIKNTKFSSLDLQPL